VISSCQQCSGSCLRHRSPSETPRERRAGAPDAENHFPSAAAASGGCRVARAAGGGGEGRGSARIELDSRGKQFSEVSYFRSQLRSGAIPVRFRLDFRSPRPCPAWRQTCLQIKVSQELRGCRAAYFYSALVCFVILSPVKIVRKLNFEPHISQTRLLGSRESTYSGQPSPGSSAGLEGTATPPLEVNRTARCASPGRNTLPGQSRPGTESSKNRENTMKN